MSIYSYPTINIGWARRGTTPQVIYKTFEENGFPVCNVEGGPVLDEMGHDKGYDSYFVGFKPTDPNTIKDQVDLFNGILSGKPVRMTFHTGEFWHLRLSNHAHHLKTMEPVGPEYDSWDGNGSYDEFVASLPEPEIMFGDGL